MSTYDPNEEVSGGNGIFIQDVEITGIEVQDQGDSPYKKDMNFKLELEFGEGEDVFTKFLWIGGNITKKGRLPQAINNLFYACKFQNETDGDKIVADFEANRATKRVIDFFVGKTIKTLSFITDKPYTAKDGTEKFSYNFWNGNTYNFRKVNTWDPDVSNETVLAAFMEKCEKDVAYAPKYCPSSVDNQSSNSSDSGDQLPPNSGSEDVEELPI